MNAAQRTILAGVLLVLFAVLLFPPFQQKYKGTKLMYAGEMGHHLRWPRPKATGEKSWLLTAPASECEVSIESGVVGRETAILAAVAAILLFGFRRWPNRPSATRTLAFTSLALALCLPVPPPDGVPVVFYVISAAISPFVDNGHLGPWFAPMVAALSLTGYFVATFLSLLAIVWCSRRLAR
jgi:hypothetical protein